AVAVDVGEVHVASAEGVPVDEPARVFGVPVRGFGGRPYDARRLVSRNAAFFALPDGVEITGVGARVEILLHHFIVAPAEIDLCKNLQVPAAVLPVADLGFRSPGIPDAVVLLCDRRPKSPGHA